METVSKPRSSTLFKNATILTMSEDDGTVPIHGDLLVEADRITAIGPEIIVGPETRLIDCRNHLLAPGLINSHLHSWEAFFAGRYDKLPLEMWMLFSYPILGLNRASRRAIELRTLLVAIESLKNGVTCVLDDVIECPDQDLDQIDAVFTAYKNSGIRANISGNIVDRRFIDTIPFIDQVLPDELLKRARAHTPRTVDEYIEFSREVIRSHHEMDGRLRYVIAPSGPQRCTSELLLAAEELSREFDISMHLHVLETKAQAVTGELQFEKTLVKHLETLKVLNERTTLAHGIWVTVGDIERIGRAGSSVVHNPISNQKLGAGIMPLRDLLDAGINVALGSDGTSSNDTSRMFDVMKSASLLQRITGPDYRRWPGADEILHAATRGGASSMRLGTEVGALKIGYKADIIMLDLTTVNFAPRNNLVNHLVYRENGMSVRRVMVNGEFVVEDGECLLVDERAVLDEIADFTPELLEEHRQIESLNDVFMPYFDEIHHRSSSHPLGLNRYAESENAWLARI